MILCTFYYIGSRKACEAKQAELDPESDQTEEKENTAPCQLAKKPKKKRKLIQKVHL